MSPLRKHHLAIYDAVTALSYTRDESVSRYAIEGALQDAGERLGVDDGEKFTNRVRSGLRYLVGRGFLKKASRFTWEAGSGDPHAKELQSERQLIVMALSEAVAEAGRPLRQGDIREWMDERGEYPTMDPARFAPAISSLVRTGDITTYGELQTPGVTGGRLLYGPPGLDWSIEEFDGIHTWYAEVLQTFEQMWRERVAAADEDNTLVRPI